MSTTDLTIFIRPPFDEEPVPPDLLRRAEVLNFQPVSTVSAAEIRVPRIRPGIFRGTIAPGTYEIRIDADTMASAPWRVPEWRVRVGGERQRLQLFMGQAGWRSYPIGYSLVPFRPPTVVGVVFETAPPTRTEADRLVPALVARFGFTCVPDSFAALRVGDRSVPRARGSILLMRGGLATHNPAEIECFVASSLNRDPTLAPPRVGVAVDLRPGSVKVLDRRFVLRHDRGRAAARASVEQNGAQWIRDLASAEGTVLFELPGGDHEKHLDVLEALRRSEEVVYAEPDLMSELQDADPLFARRWEGIPDAWQFLAGQDLPPLGSGNVTIAILDNNFPYNSAAGKIDHLQAPPNQVVDFRNFYDGPDPGGVADPLHGLKVYGVIAAETDGLGAEGVAPRTSIFIAERCAVLSNSYNDILLWLCGLTATVPGFSNASVPNPHPVDVICCAHTSGVPHTEAFGNTMQRIVTEGRIVQGAAKGAVVVYAAGNVAGDVSVKNGFADDPNTVAVANCAVDPYADESDPKKFSRVSLSNFGAAIDLCALGDQSYTLMPGGDGQWRGGGTSAACAAVAGAIGLLLTAFPEETITQIRSRLRYGARRVDPHQQDPNGVWLDDHSGYYGHGLLNVYQSMQERE